MAGLWDDCPHLDFEENQNGDRKCLDCGATGASVEDTIKRFPWYRLRHWRTRFWFSVMSFAASHLMRAPIRFSAVERQRPNDRTHVLLFRADVPASFEGEYDEP